MSSIVIKVGSLVIKTLSKPIANRIKAQAREHERFRRVCVNVAQGIHRWDMRFRLGLLQDTAAIEKQIAKDAAEARKPPTVKTEAQTKADEARAKDPERGKDAPKKQPKIRPLSEAKAIDLGANFVSETFLLAVGIALILFENARKGRQEANRREDVADQLEEFQRMNKLQNKSLKEMDKEIMRLRSKAGTSLETNNYSLLPKELRDIEEEDEETDRRKSKGWVSWVTGLFRDRSSQPEKPEPAEPAPVKAQEAPTASTSMLNKILPRSHPRDINPKPPDDKTQLESTPTSKPAAEAPVNTTPKAS